MRVTLALPLFASTALAGSKLNVPEGAVRLKPPPLKTP
jgi:hypothetical protein